MLASLGHFKGKSAEQVLAELDDTAAMEAAIKSWQEFHSRPVTGVLSSSDESLMVAPRCGIPDIMLASTNAKWGILDITVSHNMSGMNGVSQKDIEDAWLAAVNSWNVVCGIRMNPVAWSGARGSNIWAQSKNIDGRAGTLAWSYLATNNLGKAGRLEQRYELNELWTRLYLQGVIAHEIGHALGMDHDSSAEALMYPYARKTLYLPQPRDIARVVDRYGKPTAPPVNPPVDPPVTPATAINKIVVHYLDGSTVDFKQPESLSVNPFL